MARAPLLHGKWSLQRAERSVRAHILLSAYLAAGGGGGVVAASLPGPEWRAGTLGLCFQLLPQCDGIPDDGGAHYEAMCSGGSPKMPRPTAAETRGGPVLAGPACGAGRV